MLNIMLLHVAISSIAVRPHAICPDDLILACMNDKAGAPANINNK